MKMLLHGSLALALSVFSYTGIAQVKRKPAPAPRPVSEIRKADMGKKIFKYVEQMPVFRGELYPWLSEHLRYPDSARVHNVEGKAIVKFVVDAKGKVTDIAILRSSGNAYLDEEALRVTREMPDWTPGRQEGKAVDVYYTLPYTFKLED